MSTLSEFAKSARELSKNPLGVIALFIVLIYGLASVVVIQGNALDTFQRDVFVWFLVIYPVLVLATFAWLVSRHSTKLYAPRDFQDQAHWMEIQQVKAATIIAATEVARDGKPLEQDASGPAVAVKIPQSKASKKVKPKNSDRR
jgi:hypothetical protein